MTEQESMQIIIDALPVDPVQRVRQSLRRLLHEIPGCVTRIVVRKVIYDHFLAEVKKRAESLDLSPGLEKETLTFDTPVPGKALRMRGVEIISSVGEDEEMFRIAREFGIDFMRELQAEHGKRRVAFVETKQ